MSLVEDDFGFHNCGGAEVQGHHVKFWYRVNDPLTIVLSYLQTELICKHGWFWPQRLRLAGSTPTTGSIFNTCASRDEAERQIARACLLAAGSEINTRTWQQVMVEAVKVKCGETRVRWEMASKVPGLILSAK
jgi:hypothetical protein